jgi:molybdopterin-guanine dinucleotide biosynthesis protein
MVDMSNDISIVVSGRTASGKTLVVANIVKALRDAGINVSVTDALDQPPEWELEEALKDQDRILAQCSPTVVVTEQNIVRMITEAA